MCSSQIFFFIYSLLQDLCTFIQWLWQAFVFFMFWASLTLIKKASCLVFWLCVPPLSLTQSKFYSNFRLCFLSLECFSIFLTAFQFTNTYTCPLPWRAIVSNTFSMPVTRLGSWRLIYLRWHKFHFYKRIKHCKMSFDICNAEMVSTTPITPKGYPQCFPHSVIHWSAER